ncbi:DUF4178 domain-containing protein [Hyalangium versicolor]|uniref:DUF4178 domain-containing protein n=1 Tax=Hyalangium versicolor TaxID=2861190 RepID=UPI001CD00B92|nr:DUF4178 domain-containing protein [Hyalangium versicolor]
MTQGQCPSCGAPVEFTAGSALVVVCSYCQTVVAKKGLNLEAHGKIGAIVDTDSPLRLGMEGRHERVGYKLVGHLQKDHGAGPWDEWYVEFDDGRTGWLSESEGAFHLTFEAGLEQGLKLDDAYPGQRLRLRNRPYVVEERGHGRVVSAAGQLPSDVDPEQDSYYVDATGPKGAFVTLDFGTRTQDPEVFLGQRLKLEQLGIPLDQMRPRVRKVSLQQARCPQCNGALELRAPDQTRRVACPYCGALLDASQGKLAFLQLLEKPEYPPLIPLGAKGQLDGVEWICIGFMVRSCTVEGTRYPWEEYLLFHKGRGFTWLMQSNGHWVFLKPIDAGDVSLVPQVAAHYEGRRYKAFQSVSTVTEAVLGEFYWEVRAGEMAQAVEYVAPPYSVNEDSTSNEVTFTHGEYLLPAAIQQAFQLKEPLPPPQGVAPSQPNPHTSASAWKWAGIWAVVLVVLSVFFNARAANELVLDTTVKLEPEAVSGQPSAMHFSEPFEIHKRGNVRADMSAQYLSNDWLGVQGDLVNQDTGEVTSFYGELSSYSGRDDEGVWSEGERNQTEYLSAVDPGTYVLRTTAAFAAGGGLQQVAGRSYRVALTSDEPRGSWFFCALVLLLVGPLLSFTRSSGFESTRWNESNLGK